MSSAADARWDAFLAKIRARSGEILAEATEGTAQFVAQPDFDTNALARLWGAIRIRLIELRRKIDDTWRGSVEPLFAGGAQDAARARGAALDDALELDFLRAEVAAWATVGRAIARRAAEMRVADAACMHCGRRRSVVGVRATFEWTCESCRATATFQPSTFEYQLEGAAGYIAAERAFEAHRALHDAGARATPALLAAYWQPYLAAIAELLPERAATLAADVAAKVAAGERPR